MQEAALRKPFWGTSVLCGVGVSVLRPGVEPTRYALWQQPAAGQYVSRRPVFVRVSGRFCLSTLEQAPLTSP